MIALFSFFLPPHKRAEIKSGRERFSACIGEKKWSIWRGRDSAPTKRTPIYCNLFSTQIMLLWSKIIESIPMYINLIYIGLLIILYKEKKKR
ncbi:hypothetical protein ASG21_15780 [Chryseobacterium sp. Leaf394]|nr:hypothetical protein ASG21_15780 [Chryseobacterium sp. Leaf394]